MFRLIYLLLLLVSTNICIGQQISADAALINKKLKSSTQGIETDYGFNENSRKGIGYFVLNIYQEYISSVISADCIYSLTCSRYSKQCIHKYGFVKGVLLTADRLTRCSSFSARDIPDYKFDEEGNAEDLP